MAQKLEEMMNEFRYPTVITTDKQINATNGYYGASSGIALLGASGSATVAGGSITLNTQRGVATTASLSTGTLAVTSFDIVDSLIGAQSLVFASVYNGTNTGGAATIGTVQVKTAGSATVTIVNAGGAALGAFNGTLLVPFVVLG